MVGDTVYDVMAERRADVCCIGLLSGGISEAELRDAGAAEVYAGPADLLGRLRAARSGGWAPERATAGQKLTPHFADSCMVTAATPMPMASETARPSHRMAAPGTGPPRPPGAARAARGSRGA